MLLFWVHFHPHQLLPLPIGWKSLVLRTKTRPYRQKKSRMCAREKNIQLTVPFQPQEERPWERGWWRSWLKTSVLKLSIPSLDLEHDTKRDPRNNRGHSFPSVVHINSSFKQVGCFAFRTTHSTSWDNHSSTILHLYLRLQISAPLCLANQYNNP